MTDTGARVEVKPGTLVVFADLGCPWAHACVHRLHAARRHLALDDRLRFDVRPFPLEIVNERPTPFEILQREVATLREVAPDAGWHEWPASPSASVLSAWPVTMLLPMEAVAAAKEQGLEASEHLDLELRRAFFGAGRCISMRHEILDVAIGCGRVDADALAEALDDGRARRSMLSSYWSAAACINGSPHVFGAEGASAHNPGIEFHWDGEEGKGRLVIDADDPSVYEDLVKRAAA